MSIYSSYTEATLKFRSYGKPATQSVRQTQQREAVVQGRSLSPYWLRYTLKFPKLNTQA
ncbi:MAG: hypothetical protein LBJ00_13885 [Planctomycetaceae bacterium]|nr:hypothetical protein [Planctomycetaceae bacterium]